jgi:SAM-dependent methyltransferase
MKEFFHHRANCRLCQSRAVEVVVPLAPIPIATPNIGMAAKGAEGEGLASALVPLDLYLCRDCGHLQLLDIINPEVQYTHFAYTTSISLGLTEHFGRMADTVIERAKLAPDSLVVEVGSNDGTLLRFFKERGMRVLGIDPARETALRATAEGIETLPTFFTTKLADEIRAKHGPAAVVISNNTFANLDALDDPTVGIRRLLADDGLFVFETQHGADVIKRMLIDTIYHEHLSYFLVGPLVPYFARHGMEFFAVEHLTTKGGSIRGYCQLAGGPYPPDGSVAQITTEETAAGLDKPDTYRHFVERLTALRTDLARAITAEAQAGHKIAGYGASVGTVTLINQFDLGRSLEMVFDDKPLTDALLGPGYRIPVLPADALYEQRPDLVVILAWRYADQIIAKHQRYIEGGGRFVVPWPTFSIRETADTA